MVIRISEDPTAADRHEARVPDLREDHGWLSFVCIRPTLKSAYPRPGVAPSKDPGTTAGRIPDWFGNNGRTVVQALFQGPNCVINTVNYGCYDNTSVNSLITQAEGATSLSAAGSFWHQADMQIMSDAVIVPVMNQNFPTYSSSRVRGIASNGQAYPTAIFEPNIGAPDITALWLANG